MPRLFTVLVILAGALLTNPLTAAESPVSEAEATASQFLENYCQDCHSGDAAEAGLRLEELLSQLDMLGQHDEWIRISEMVRSQEMPPGDEPQPTPQQRQQFLDWVDAALKAVDCRQTSQPGRVTIRRLNRAEYNNTIRDLMGVDFQPAKDFPADDVGNGFDNIAEVLSLPPLLMEKYFEAAEQIVDRALSNEGLRDRFVAQAPTEPQQFRGTARRVLEPLATRAFRRPVRAGELDRLLDLVQQAAEAGADYPSSIGLALQAILTSPHFLFRIELDDPASEGNQPRALNGYELATRLSYFLWSSMPDETLFELAAADRLQDATVRHEQVLRMLADPRSQALVDNFAAQWLELRNLAKLTPDTERFQEFDEPLRQAMQKETELFFREVMTYDRSILEFLDADYTFVNGRLARHYGISDVQGDAFRKVQLSDPRRGGLLTQASILTLTSNPTRTSPVKRGKWILENILGAPPPPPPPGVQQLSEDGQAELLGSLRERMEQHRSDPSCAVCHKKMDALGFGFENFDAVGAWRERDGQFPIDASGELPGGQYFAGPQDLRKVLMTSRRDEFLRCLSEKMLTYALGRGLESYDRCTIDEIVNRLETNDYRFSALLLAVVDSEAFLMRGFRGENE